MNEVVGVEKMGDIYATENRLTHKWFSVHFLSFCPPILLLSLSPLFSPSSPPSAFSLAVIIIQTVVGSKEQESSIGFVYSSLELSG